MTSSVDLKPLFQTLLCSTSEEFEVVRLLSEIKTILQNKSEPLSQTYESSTDVCLSQGVAINPELAAQCFSDYLRTHRFMLGTYQCVSQLLEQGMKPVTILYAGTGPFATIVLPLLYLFDQDQIEISAIEINTDAYRAANHLLYQLGKEDYFKSFHLADAITYTTDNKYDIIISETMDKALCREPQLAIFNNLVSYLSPTGYLIPECIKVDLVASSIYLEKDVPYYVFDDVETRILNMQHRQFIDTIVCADKVFFENNMLIPNQQLFLKSIETQHVNDNLNELIFLTEVKIFGNVILLEDDSTLTKKYICYSFAENEKGKEFDLFYLNNESPRIALFQKS